MLELHRTAAFATWIDGLKDAVGRARILARIDRLAHGHEGDAAPVGGGVHELRVHVGPGYRVYYARRGERVVLLLAGGDKGTQRRDIAAAIRAAEQWRKEWQEDSK